MTLPEAESVVAEWYLFTDVVAPFGEKATQPSTKTNKTSIATMLFLFINLFIKLA